jgi:hypothetical protein
MNCLTGGKNTKKTRVSIHYQADAPSASPRVPIHLRGFRAGYLSGGTDVAALGVGAMPVHDRIGGEDAGVPEGTPDQPERVIGRDGKSYAAGRTGHGV